MRRRVTPSEAWLLVAFAAMILCFWGATVYSLGRSAAIDTMAGNIADHAAPRVQHLAASRAMLRREQLLLDDYIDALVEGTPARSLAEFDRLRRELRQEVDLYYRIPAAAAGREVTAKLQAAVAAHEA